VGLPSELMRRKGDLPVPLFVPWILRFRGAEARATHHVNVLASQQTGRKAETRNASCCYWDANANRRAGSRMAMTCDFTCPDWFAEKSARHNLGKGQGGVVKKDACEVLES
jgi:hypothetical protein